MAKPGSQRNPTIDSLKDRIARDPFSRAFLQLADEYRKEGRFREAIAVCLEGLERHPTYHTARISLGRTYMEAGNVENARRAFSEVLELQPENHLAGKLLAEIQRKMGDLAGAAATYRAILRYYPSDREVAALLQETQPQRPTASTIEAPEAIPAPPTPQSVAGRGPSPAAARAASTAPVPLTTAGQEGAAMAVTGQGTMPAITPPPLMSGVNTRRPSDPSPDFRQEDLGGVPVTRAKETWSAPAAGAPAPWPVPSRDDKGGPMDDALQTNTLAELYLRQGLVDRAVDVYRGMLRVDPQNQKAARRLNDLVPGSVPPPTAKAAGPATGPLAEAGIGPAAPASVTAAPQRIASLQAAQEKDDGGHRRETIHRLERWLANVRASASKRAAMR